jgi:hypothetical protein
VTIVRIASVKKPRDMLMTDEFQGPNDDNLYINRLRYPMGATRPVVVLLAGALAGAFFAGLGVYVAAACSATTCFTASIGVTFAGVCFATLLASSRCGCALFAAVCVRL